MSILIRGMEMPKNCIDCKFPSKDYNEELYCPFTGIYCLNICRQINCPLVEVPPHGRLIDADALKEKWLAAENRIGADKVLHLPLKDYISDGCVYDLEQMPTIIEAEVET